MSVREVGADHIFMLLTLRTPIFSKKPHEVRAHVQEFLKEKFQLLLYGVKKKHDEIRPHPFIAPPPSPLYSQSTTMISFSCFNSYSLDVASIANDSLGPPFYSEKLTM